MIEQPLRDRRQFWGGCGKSFPHGHQLAPVTDIIRSCSWSCDSVEPVPRDQSEELQRGSLRVFFATLPLADDTYRHIQIAGEDGLARTFP
jgi:hypothetical protein